MNMRIVLGGSLAVGQELGVVMQTIGCGNFRVDRNVGMGMFAGSDCTLRTCKLSVVVV